MITRFDHAVIAVPDVAAAIEAYAGLGFDVSAGGRHPSIGTSNAIVRFGLDYLELLAIEDPAQARASGPFGAELAEFLARRSGLIGFVFASDDLDAAAQGLGSVGIDSTGPFAMDRERPDGRRLAWRLVIPGDSPWRKPWPFLIEWETPDGERLSWDAPGEHRNETSGVAGLDLLVSDVAAARRLYEQALGLVPRSSSADGASYRVGDFTLDVHAPRSETEQSELDTDGPGPCNLRLRGGRAQTLDNEAALGARISTGH